MILMRRFSFLVVLSLLTTSVQAADAAPSFEVRGLRIVGEAYGEQDMQTRPFNWSKGTTVVVLVTLPRGGIIAFDPTASKVETFVDDKGSNMLETKSSQFHFGGGPFGSWPKISKDAKAAVIELQSKQVPAKGATKLSAKGTLVFKKATRKKTYTHKDVALKVGTKIEAGSIPFEVTKVGKPQWGSDKDRLAVTLKATQDLSKIAAVRFLDAEEKEIKSRPFGTTKSSAFGKTTIQQSYRLEQKVDAVTVAIDYWEDMEVLNLPFEVEASVGL